MINVVFGLKLALFYFRPNLNNFNTVWLTNVFMLLIKNSKIEIIVKPYVKKNYFLKVSIY